MNPFFQNDYVTLYNGDSFEIVPQLGKGIFDAVITDPPYGTTQLAWDVKIDFRKMHEMIRNAGKRNAARLVFCTMPMAVDVAAAARDEFRYELIWEKTQKQGFLNAKKMPLRAHENIFVFYSALPTYNPIKFKAETPRHAVHHGKNGKRSEMYIGRVRHNSVSDTKPGIQHPKCKSIIEANYTYVDDGSRYPTDIIKVSNWNGSLFGMVKRLNHPTAKPVILLQYLVSTFTNEGDTILDPFGGGGSTAVAAMLRRRKCVIVEREERYCEMTAKRLEKVQERFAAQFTRH